MSCRCGLKTFADGSTVSRFNHEWGDLVAIQIERMFRFLRISKPAKCGCSKRQRQLNELGRLVQHRVIRPLYHLATWLHPNV